MLTDVFKGSGRRVVAGALRRVLTALRDACVACTVLVAYDIVAVSAASPEFLQAVGLSSGIPLAPDFALRQLLFAVLVVTSLQQAVAVAVISLVLRSAWTGARRFMSVRSAQEVSANA